MEEINNVMNRNRRVRFTDDGWHINNPTFAKHWLGMVN